MTSPREARAFVAGATGYVGRSVVAELCTRGVETIAHVRPDSTRLAEWTERFSALGASVDSTAWDAVAMSARLCELRPTLVYALLGTTQKRAQQAARSGAPASDYETVDYGLSALLLKAASTCEPPPKFVYLSAAGVSDGTRNPYLLARVRLERELRASGVHFIIARPAFVTGDDREEHRPVERLSARVGDVVLALAGALGARKLQQRWASLTGHALAQSLVRLGMDPNAVNLVVGADGLRGSNPPSGN